MCEKCLPNNHGWNYQEISLFTVTLGRARAYKKTVQEVHRTGTRVDEGMHTKFSVITPKVDGHFLQM